ncbi:nucleoporin autopeptidase-domain-containing protein [Umbelopsis sp. PMI_123]|nr:nucleoporin autopeptidase-domain-containing protein [Umbelopsis sp. PMI_123]
MPAYRNFSVEELRVQDYQAGRKNAGNTGGAFGATGGFGGQTSTPFGQSAATNTFGMPSTSTAGSAFGQSTGGFGQNTGGFGQANTGGFGSANAGTTGGLFGQQTATSAPAFGSTQPANTGFGGTSFGQQPQQQQQQSTGFGSTATPGFGASNAAKPFSFGSTPATSQASTGFGAAGASPFGQQPQQQQQSVGGLFGQAAQSTPSFGQQATGTGFGFGQKPAAQTTTGGFGGFGASTANKPATTFSFGSAAPPATSTAAPTGFGGFGANTGAAGFGSTGAASGGLFGASKPAASTGLFGSTTQPTTFGGFGSTANTGLGSGLFGTKPATSNVAAPSLFGNTQQTTGGFGFGNQLANTANTFSLPATGGLTTFGTTGLQQQPNANQQPPLYASLDKYPYGYNPLFENLPAGTNTSERSSSVAVSEEPSKKLSTTPHFMITPRSATKIKLRGYSFTPTGELVSRKTGGLDGISDDAVLRPEAFAPRPSIKRLVINKKVSPSELSTATNSGAGVLSTGSKAKVVFDPHLEYIATQDQANNDTRESTKSDNKASTSEPSKPANRNTAFSDNAIAQGYYIKPSLQVLGNQSRQQLKNVKNLVIGLKGVGEITFEGPVDLSEIDLDQIMVGIVNFQPKTCTVYPDEDAKPPQGQGLNVPATIKLEKCYPVDKTTKQPITDPQHPRVIAIIRKLRAVPETEFIDFDASTGTWTFKVQHF